MMHPILVAYLVNNQDAVSGGFVQHLPLVHGSASWFCSDLFISFSGPGMVMIREPKYLVMPSCSAYDRSIM